MCIRDRVLEENTDREAWDAVIENNDELLEKYIAGEPVSYTHLDLYKRQQENQSAGKNLRGRNSSGFKTPPCSQSIMAAPKMALAFNR